MIKHYCDKCGAEIADDMKDNVKIGLWCGLETDMPTFKVFHYELCNDCSGKLTELISGINEAQVFEIN